MLGMSVAKKARNSALVDVALGTNDVPSCEQKPVMTEMDLGEDV